MSKILVIDDDQLVVRTICIALEKHGYTTKVATDPENAISLARDHIFDLIISDIRMPNINGVEAVKRMRSIFDQKIRKDVPIIFITGFAELPLELNAKKYGEVILKPFDLDRLLVTIREYL